MKNITIFGAHVNNKGAQSMLFTVVDKIREKYPNCKISVISDDKVNNEMRDIYNFEFVEIKTKDKLKTSGPLFKGLSYLRKNEVVMEPNQNYSLLFKETDIFIDISGFALSSKFTRNNTLNYLSHLSIAKKYDKPIYLLPQSFGPFDYKKTEKPILIYLIKKYLKYATKIYTRESDGYNHLSKLKLKNIEKSLDTVLQKNDDYDLSNIYKKEKKLNILTIKPNSVGIIPNQKTLNNQNRSHIYSVYKESILELLKNKKTVYLLRHSTEDLSIIEKIYENFKENENVILIRDEYSSIELQKIIEQFNFIIASRYHSIVHAYKVGTPALVIGWAVKYKELLSHFEQKAYQFSIENLEINEFINGLNLIEINYNQESTKIKKIMNDYSGEDLFKSIL